VQREKEVAALFSGTRKRSGPGILRRKEPLSQFHHFPAGSAKNEKDPEQKDEDLHVSFKITN